MRNLILRIIACLGCFLPHILFAQEGNVTSWDEQYDQYTIKEFMELTSLQDTLQFDQLDLGLLNAAVFFVSNAVRVQAGKEALQFSPVLRNMADHHARAMAKYAFVSHYNWRNWRSATPDRRSKMFKANAGAENVASAFLYNYQGGVKYIIKRRNGVAHFHRDKDHSEIVRHTYLSFAEDLVRRWMESPGHRENLLHNRLTRLGCAVRVGEGELDKNEIPLTYCVQEFGW